MKFTIVLSLLVIQAVGWLNANLNAAGYDNKSLLDYGITQEEIDSGSVSIEALKARGIEVNETTTEESGGSTSTEYVTVEELESAGITIQYLLEQGVSQSEIDSGKISIADLKKYGVDVAVTEEVRKGTVNVKQNGIILYTLLESFGLDVNVLKYLGLSDNAYDQNGDVYLRALSKIGITKYRGQLRITVHDLNILGYTKKDLRKRGIIHSDFVGSGPSATIQLNILKKHKIYLRYTRKRRTVSLSVLKTYGINIKVLKLLGITSKDYDSKGNIYISSLNGIGIYRKSGRLTIKITTLIKLGISIKDLRNAGIHTKDYQGSGANTVIRLDILKRHNIYLNVLIRDVISYLVLESYGLDVNVLTKLGIQTNDFNENSDVDTKALRRVGIYKTNGKLTITIKTLNILGYTEDNLRHAGINSSDYIGSGSTRRIRLTSLRRHKIFLNATVRHVVAYRNLESYGLDVNVLTKLGIQEDDYDQNGDVYVNALKKIGIIVYKGKLYITVKTLNRLGYTRNLLKYAGVHPSDYEGSGSTLRIRLMNLRHHKVYLNVPIRPVVRYSVLESYGLDVNVLGELGITTNDYDRNGDVDVRALKRVGIVEEDEKLTITVRTLTRLGYTQTALKRAGVRSSDYLGSGSTRRIRLKTLKRLQIFLNVPLENVHNTVVVNKPRRIHKTRRVISITILTSYGLNYKTLRFLGLKNSDIDSNGNITIRALKRVGIVEEDEKLTITVRTLTRLGYTQTALKRAGVRSSDYLGSGSTRRIRLKTLKRLQIFLNVPLENVDNTVVVDKPRRIHKTRRVISITILTSYGLNYKTLKFLGLKNSDIDSNGNITIRALRRIGIYVRRNVLYISVKALRQLGYTSYDLQYAGIRQSDFVGTGKSAKISLKTLRRHGIIIRRIHRTQTVRYTDLKDYGLNYDLLKILGITRKAINAKGEVHVKTLAKNGIYYENDKLTITLDALKTLGYNKRDLINAGITDSYIIGTGRYARVCIIDLIEHKLFWRRTKRSTRTTATRTATSESVSLAYLYSLGFTPSVLQILGIRYSQLGSGQNIRTDVLNKYGIEFSGNYGFVSVKRLYEIGITQKILAEYGITSKHIEYGLLNVKYLTAVISQMYNTATVNRNYSTSKTWTGITAHHNTQAQAQTQAQTQAQAQAQVNEYYTGPTTKITYTAEPKTVEAYETSEEPVETTSYKYETSEEPVETTSYKYETSEEPAEAS